MGWILALTGSLAAVPACGGGGGAGGASAEPSPAEPRPAPPPGGGEPGAVPAPAMGLTVFFRLDPRLTTSSYLGERWVAPATFTLVVEDAELVVNVRAHVVEASGTRQVRATWTPADPDMLAVSAREGHEISIAVRRAGRSALTVACAEGSRELIVTAVQDAGVWRADVTQ